MIREFETINSPWSSESEVGNTTSNWGLWAISPPGINTQFIFIASRNNSQPSPEQLALLLQNLNDSAPKIFPVWDNSIIANFYVSIYKNKSGKVYDNNDKLMESLRIIGDGCVFLHNTPTLWDQGSFAVGQFQTDISNVPVDPDSSLATLEYTSGATPGSATFRITYQGPNNGGVLMPSTAVNPATPGIGFIGQNVGAQFRIKNPNTGGLFINFPNVTNPNLNITYVPQAGNVEPYYNLVQTGNNPPFRITPIPAGQVQRIPMELEGEVVEEIQNKANYTVWDLPPLSQADIVQADPKFSAELMKNHEGFYWVRRFFEPQMNMTDVSNTGIIKFRAPGVPPPTSQTPFGGISFDVFDKNGASVVAVIRGISHAAAPTIKICKFVEFMPSPGSPLAPFCGDCPMKDEDAVEIFRQIQTSGPHSYIPDANALGLMAAMLGKVIEYLPRFLRGARSISQAVMNVVDWTENTLFPSTK